MQKHIAITIISFRYIKCSHTTQLLITFIHDNNLKNFQITIMNEIIKRDEFEYYGSNWTFKLRFNYLR